MFYLFVEQLILGCFVKQLTENEARLCQLIPTDLDRLSVSDRPLDRQGDLSL